MILIFFWKSKEYVSKKLRWDPENDPFSAPLKLKIASFSANDYFAAYANYRKFKTQNSLDGQEDRFRAVLHGHPFHGHPGRKWSGEAVGP